MTLSLEYLKSRLRYDPQTGEFIWLRGLRAGRVARAKRPDGYVRIGLDGRLYYAHRLAFFYMTAEWPLGEVDHANGQPSDNRWANLRDATRSQNRCNRRASEGRLKGASPARSRWRATINLEGRQHHLGVFDTPEEAHAAYVTASAALHGPFGRAA